MSRRYSIWMWLAVAVALSPMHQSCTCGDNLLASDPNIGPKTNHMLNCACRVNFTNLCQQLGGAPASLNVPLNICLPPPLNTSFDAGAAELSDGDYSAQVFAFCEQTVATDVKRLIYSLSQAACSNGCIDSVQCEPQALPSGLDTGPNKICDMPCDSAQCIIGHLPDGGIPDGGISPNDAGIGNCDPDQVVPEGSTTSHPEFCKCNIAGPDCEGESTNQFCLPPPGNEDPSSIRSGLLTKLTSAPSSIKLNHDTSVLQLHVSFEDLVGIDHNDTEQIHANGEVTFYGVPCPGAACDLLLDMNIYPDDATFSFSNVVCGIDCLHDVNVNITKAGLVGGMGSIRVHVNPDGTGHIPVNSLHLHAEAIVAGIPDRSAERKIYDRTNDVPLDFVVDWTAKTFTLPAAPFNFDGADGTMTLSGVIVNQPPRASATSPTVECNAPSSAMFMLDGTASTDPDGDPLLASWWRDLPLEGASIGSGITSTTTAPLGTSTYYLSVIDKQLAISFAKSTVTVVDTIGPAISAAPEPACLWSPNHKMVLYTLDDLGARTADTCDPSATVKVINVTSNQSSAQGSGHTTTDVRFGEGALCVRAERDETIKADREYTVTLIAGDASGNTTTRSVIIRVPYNQNDCRPVDRGRLVEDDDPRCVAGTAPRTAPARFARSKAVLPDDPGAAAPASGHAGGCSTGSDVGGCMALFVAAVVVLRRRRLRFTVAWLALGACGNSEGLEARATGWWQGEQPGGCLCPVAPECQFSDCQAFQVRGLLQDHRYYDGHINVSSTAGTMSSAGTLSFGTWTLAGSQLVIKQEGVPDYMVEIAADRTTLHFGFEIDVRPSEGIIDGLDRATADGARSWKSVPIQ